MLEVVAAIIDVSFAKGFKMNFLLCKSATMIFFAKLEVAGRRLFIATNLLMKISFMQQHQLRTQFLNIYIDTLAAVLI